MPYDLRLNTSLPAATRSEWASGADSWGSCTWTFSSSDWSRYPHLPRAPVLCGGAVARVLMVDRRTGVRNRRDRHRADRALHRYAPLMPWAPGARSDVRTAAAAATVGVTVMTVVTKEGQEIVVNNPSLFPEQHDILTCTEPVAEARIIAPKEYLSPLLRLCLVRYTFSLIY